MTFAKYKEAAEKYFEERDKSFQVLCLVSDTANLLEKIRYFRNETSLMLAELGDVFFRAFAMLDEFGYELTAEPIDIEDMKMKTDQLDKMFAVSESDLVQNFMLELGVISNIMSNNLKYNTEEFTEDDNKRMKAALYAYILYALILSCKCNFSIDRVLDFNISKLRANGKEMNFKTVES